MAISLVVEEIIYPSPLSFLIKQNSVLNGIEMIRSRSSVQNIQKELLFTNCDTILFVLFVKQSYREQNSNRTPL